MASTLTSLGNAHGALGDHAKKRKRALAIYERAYGRDHPKVAFPLANLDAEKKKARAPPAAPRTTWEPPTAGTPTRPSLSGSLAVTHPPSSPRRVYARRGGKRRARAASERGGGRGAAPAPATYMIFCQPVLVVLQSSGLAVRRLDPSCGACANSEPRRCLLNAAASRRG